MIVRTLKPSLIFRAVGASIENKSFGCFVSTAKTGLFSRKSTIVFFREYGTRLDSDTVGHFVYSQDLSWKGRIRHHNAMVATLDRLGEEGQILFSALEALYRVVLEKGVIEPSPFWGVGATLADAMNKQHL